MLRRGFAILLLAVGAAWANAADAARIISGPMIGHVTDTDARIWLQLDTVDSVRIKAFDTDTNQEVSNISMDVEGPSPFVVDAPVNGLAPGRNYRVEVSIGEKPVPLVPPPVIRTAPSQGQIDDVCIAFGSGIDNRGAAMPIFKAVTAMQPRAFLFLGNLGNFPADLKDWPQMRRPAFRFMCEQRKDIRNLPDMLEMLRSTAIYGIWDEGDFGTQGSDGKFVFARESLASFQRYWPNPSYGTPENPGCYCKFSIADVDLFLLDDRTFRDKAPADGTPAMLGDAQLKWLESGLANSRAAIKLIASGTQMLQTNHGGDSWGAFPDERSSFLHWMTTKNIEGVVFVSGGRGIGELTALRPSPKNAGGYPLFELTSIGLSGSQLNAGDNPDRVGSQATGDQFGTVDVTGPRGRRTISLRLRDPQGRALIEQVTAVGNLRSTK